MRKTEFRVATITAVSSLLILLGAPSLSTGADHCAPGSRLAATSSCPSGTSSSSQPSSLRAYSTAAAPRQAPADPATTPPLHGTEPHGQGTVAVIDTNPDPTRPYSNDPAGGTREDIVVGRSRGEQRADGTYNGHITIAALFGNEILGVNTTPGETKSGPLSAAQMALLTPLCDGSGNQICLTAVTADSSTTSTGSTNRFSAAHVTLGGAEGIDAGAAESNGNISSDGTCQVSHGDSSVADVKIGGSAVASVAKSSTDSKACNDGTAPTQTNTSSVIALGGTGVPVPAAGCADGTPDTVTGIPTLLPIVCNGDDINGDQADDTYGVREALAAYLLATPTAAAAKLTTAASESRAVAPPRAGGGGGGNEECADGIDNDGDGKIDAADPDCHTDGNPNNPDSFDPGRSEAGRTQCSDGRDNDGDGVADIDDPGCHTDGDASNPDSFNPADNNESNGGGTAGVNDAVCSDGKDNDGDGVIDADDPGCHSDGNANNPASYEPDDPDESNGGGTAGVNESACSDGADNDGDGVSDAADPGCHTDGNANNPASYDPNDDSELNGGVAGVSASSSLPRTGSDVIGAALIGALLLAAGLVLRRAPSRGVSR